MAQWYGKVPADENIVLKLPPGGMEPEFHAPPLAEDVCVVESLLVHVTVPPTATTIGFGAKAVVVIVDAPATIDAMLPADVELPPPEAGGGVGETVEGEDEPHAMADPSSSVTRAIWHVL
jgi:hypothetical protein